MIDLLAENADVVVRYQGGNNAGHTVVAKQQKFVLHLPPSGILHENVICVLGDGMVVDLEHLTNEIAQIREKGVVVTPNNLKNFPNGQQSLCLGTKFRMNSKKHVLQKQEQRLVPQKEALPMHTVTNTERRHCVLGICFI